MAARPFIYYYKLQINSSNANLYRRLHLTINKNDEKKLDTNSIAKRIYEK